MSKFSFPKPRNEDIFEDLTTLIYREVLHNPNLQRYGRRGQKQGGIDHRSVAGRSYGQSPKVVVIQCKNHPDGINSKDQLKNELIHDLSEFDKSGLSADEFVFATSAASDNSLIRYAEEITNERSKSNKSAVVVKFWNFFEENLERYPAIRTWYLEDSGLILEKPTVLSLPDLNTANRNTYFCTSQEITDSQSSDIIKKFVEQAKDNPGLPHIVEKYNLYIGLTQGKKSFDKQVDIEIDIQELIGDEAELEQKFQNSISFFTKFSNILKDGFFSSEPIIFSDIEITHAFVLGRSLRKHGIKPMFIFKDQVFTVDETVVPLVSPDIDSLPSRIVDINSKDGVLFFDSCGVDMAIDDVSTYLGNQGLTPKVQLAFKSCPVRDSAHAFAVSRDIARKIHFMEGFGVRNIHLFILAPKPITAMIGYLIKANSLRSSLHLYFFNKDRNSYVHWGKIDNNT